MKILVVIGTINPEYNLGREHPPKPEDSDTIGELMEASFARFASDPWYDMDTIKVRTPDGRDIELIPEEVRLVHFGTPNVVQYVPAPEMCESCETIEDYSTTRRDDPWLSATGLEPHTLCDSCYNSAVQDAQEEADRKMGDATP